MDLKIFCSFLLTISLCCAQSNNDFLVEFHLSLREERIPSILNYLFNNTLESNEITTTDIVQLSKLDRYDLDAAYEVLRYFNITDGIFTVDNLEKLLVAVDYKFQDFFNAVTDKLHLTTIQTQQAVKELDIPDLFWMYIVLKDHDNIFDSLRKGVYDDSHISEVLITLGSSKNQIYQASRDAIIEFVEKLESPAFMNLLKQNGWDKRAGWDWYKALNLTAEDVYSVDKFNRIFTKISNQLNENKTFGVFVGETEIAVHLTLYEQLEKLVDGITIKIEADGHEVFPRKDKYLGEHIVSLHTAEERANYIEIVSNYSSVEECSYFTVSNGQVKKWDVTVNGFSVEKSADLEFILGSPLVCDDQLYGLAHEETEEEIIFDSFFTDDNPPPDDFVGIQNSASSFTLSVAFNLIVFLLFVH